MKIKTRFRTNQFFKYLFIDSTERKVEDPSIFVLIIHHNTHVLTGIWVTIISHVAVIKLANWSRV